jgi:hypothetical protein
MSAIYSHISEQRRQQALHADLAKFLIGIGEPLVFDGRSYRHRKYWSLAIYKDKYFWGARADKGHPVDFLTKYLKADYEGAVLELTKPEEREP